MDPKRSSPNVSLDTLFSGKKAKWLPLYRRLIARLSHIQGIEVLPARTNIALEFTGASSCQVAQIRVTATGLDLSLALRKAQLKSPLLKPVTGKSSSGMSHRTLLATPSDLDEELIGWLKAAKRTGERH